MHHIPLYGRVAWSSTYTWCTQKSRAADERQRVSDMPSSSTSSTSSTTTSPILLDSQGHNNIRILGPSPTTCSLGGQFIFIFFNIWSAATTHTSAATSVLVLIRPFKN